VFAQVCPYQTPRHDGVVGANLRVRPGEGEGGIEVATWGCQKILIDADFKSIY